jgi:hypothetical protein
VLADFANSTGDTVFDDTLRQGLAGQLDQSPFLNLDDRLTWINDDPTFDYYVCFSALDPDQQLLMRSYGMCLTAANNETKMDPNGTNVTYHVYPGPSMCTRPKKGFGGHGIPAVIIQP